MITFIFFAGIGRRFQSPERRVYVDWTSVSFPLCQRSCHVPTNTDSHYTCPDTGTSVEVPDISNASHVDRWVLILCISKVISVGKSMIKKESLVTLIEGFYHLFVNQYKTLTKCMMFFILFLTNSLVLQWNIDIVAQYLTVMLQSNIVQ